MLSTGLNKNSSNVPRHCYYLYKEGRAVQRLTREAPAKCSSLLVVLVMGQAEQAVRGRAGAMS